MNNSLHSILVRSALIVGLCGLATASLFAGVASPTLDESATTSKTRLRASYELEANYSYVGDAETRLGRGARGDVSEQSSFFHYVVTPQWNDGPLFRFGLECQRYSFGLPNLAPLPNTLQALNAVVGMDLQFFESWLMRIEAQPGFYGDFSGVRARDFNVPVIVGGSYIASADLQWILGLSVDLNREYPLIPAVGMRWKFADRWVLNAVLPNPRLEFQPQKGITFYAGGEIKSGTFRVDSSFGQSHNIPRLDAAVVEYDEARVGGGVEWKVSPDVSLNAEAGYMPYREFNFHRAETRFRTDGGAAYGQFAFSARF